MSYPLDLSLACCPSLDLLQLLCVFLEHTDKIYSHVLVRCSSMLTVTALSLYCLWKARSQYKWNILPLENAWMYFCSSLFNFHCCVGFWKVIINCLFSVACCACSLLFALKPTSPRNLGCFCSAKLMKWKTVEIKLKSLVKERRLNCWILFLLLVASQFPKIRICLSWMTSTLQELDVTAC